MENHRFSKIIKLFTTALCNIYSFLTKFNIPSNVPQRIERLKIALALKELDYLVQVMQSAYQKVEIEFNKLKQKLYLKKKA